MTPLYPVTRPLETITNGGSGFYFDYAPQPPTRNPAPVAPLLREIRHPEYPDMQLVRIPNCSNYAISPHGDVFRIDPPKKGGTAADRFRRVMQSKPVKNFHWRVNLYNDDGKRLYYPTHKLVQLCYGNQSHV